MKIISLYSPCTDEHTKMIIAFLKDIYILGIRLIILQENNGKYKYYYSTYSLILQGNGFDYRTGEFDDFEFITIPGLLEMRRTKRAPSPMTEYTIDDNIL